MNAIQQPVTPPANSTAAPDGAGVATQRVEVLGDGTRVVIRPIRPLDLELERRFINELSPRSRRFRFLESMASASDALLKQMTVLDPATDTAYIALITVDGEEREIAVARFSAKLNEKNCEFAVTVSDAWQNKGLGTLMMKCLIDAARARGVESMYSSDSADNDLMRKFAGHLGFQHRADPDDGTQIIYSIPVTPAGPA